MKDFLTKDFLLNTEAAKKLFHEAAEACPIIDYHCHLSPKEIWEDIRYDNITQVWLGGDHYKWRLMRSAGVPEKYVTGDAPDREKFEKGTETVNLFWDITLGLFPAILLVTWPISGTARADFHVHTAKGSD